MWKCMMALSPSLDVWFIIINLLFNQILTTDFSLVNWIEIDPFLVIALSHYSWLMQSKRLLRLFKINRLLKFNYELLLSTFDFVHRWWVIQLPFIIGHCVLFFCFVSFWGRATCFGWLTPTLIHFPISASDYVRDRFGLAASARKTIDISFTNNNFLLSWVNYIDFVINLLECHILWVQ